MSDNKEREWLAINIDTIIGINQGYEARKYAIADFILEREEEIRLDERRKVAEEIKSIIFIDGTGISGNNSYNRLAKVANYCNERKLMEGK